MRNIVQGSLFIISGPSAVGKSTLCERLVKEDDLISYSVSVTTRQPRNGEKNGKDYIFISHDEFKSMIAKNELLEWAKVHENYYGTPKTEIEKKLSIGKDILLDIDTQGEAEVKKHFKDAVTLFIMPPDMETLRQRFIQRNTDNDLTVAIRLKNALYEIKKAPEYQYILINDNLEKAYKGLKNIVGAARLRSRYIWEQINKNFK